MVAGRHVERGDLHGVRFARLDVGGVVEDDLELHVLDGRLDSLRLAGAAFGLLALLGVLMADDAELVEAGAEGGLVPGGTSATTTASSWPTECCLKSDLITRPLRSATDFRTVWWAFLTSSTSTFMPTCSVMTKPDGAWISFSARFSVRVLRATWLS